MVNTVKVSVGKYCVSEYESNITYRTAPEQITAAIARSTRKKKIHRNSEQHV